MRRAISENCEVYDFDVAPKVPAVMLLPDTAEVTTIIEGPSSDGDVMTLPGKTETPHIPEMDALRIPRFLQEQYLSGSPPPVIKTLRPWQRELFGMREWQDGHNCLVLVPTSSGKTTAAEVAMAQLLDKDPTAKIIYCLPFVSLASEKFSEFTARFPAFSVRPFFGNVGGSEFSHGSIAVATFEKTHALLNSAMRGRYFDQFKLIVIDEVHMIGESHRGATLEAIVAKIRLAGEGPRIIGLSATINSDDARIYAKWMNGFVFQRNERPSDLKQYIKLMNGSLVPIEGGCMKDATKQLISTSDDRGHIIPLIRDALRSNPKNSILVFVNSRNDTRRIAFLLADNLETIVDFQLTKARLNLIKELEQVQKSIDDHTKRSIMKGVMFHHAGLLLEERKLIEKAVRQGILSVIVATTTLSAGINISNVSLVVIHSLFRKEGKGAPIPITPAQYNQMAGRAGRRADQPGEVVVIQQSGLPEEERLMKFLSSRSLGRITGHLLEEDEFDRYYLQCLYVLRNNNHRNLPYVTFEACTGSINERELSKAIEASENRLKTQRLIINEQRVTPLGGAIAGANFPIKEGLEIYETIRKMRQNCCFTDELHILFVCIPSDIQFRTPAYSHDRWTDIYYAHEKIFDLVIDGMNNTVFEQMVAKSRSSGGQKVGDRRDIQMDKLYAACILLDVIDETPVHTIEHKYGIDRGSIQSLQTNSSTVAGQVVKFCELCGFGVIGSAISRFSKRLDCAVRNELLELMTIPSCTRVIARNLFNEGIEKPDDLLIYSTREITEMIDKTASQEIENIAVKIKNEAQMMYDFRVKAQAFEDEFRFSSL